MIKSVPEVILKQSEETKKKISEALKAIDGQQNEKVNYLRLWIINILTIS